MGVALSAGFSMIRNPPGWARETKHPACSLQADPQSGGTLDYSIHLRDRKAFAPSPHLLDNLRRTEPCPRIALAGTGMLRTESPRAGQNGRTAGEGIPQ